MHLIKAIIFQFIILTKIASYASAASTPFSSTPSISTLINQQCWPWYAIRDLLRADVFDGGSCAKNARAALRLTFHDAVGYSQAQEDLGKYVGGGADGSILQFPQELSYGLRAIITTLSSFVANYPLATSTISFGDLVAFAGTLGLSYCSRAPEMMFYAGRPAAKGPAADGLVSGPEDSADDMIARFSDAGFSADELVALLASHSVAAASTLDAAILGAPLDTTPEKFDTRFFNETLSKGKLWPGTPNHYGEVMSPARGQVRLQSDFVLARDARTAPAWRRYANDADLMRRDFAETFLKMTLVGQNVSELVDCTEVLRSSI
ncbi:heme peroxidase [Sistotremastrum niveocremeum HHB9708]|uniref:Peroxidase n=1 Tax=Sistotremastrum niveocremeum HHB9708 TaxID=1314777 RepID=A0A164SL59_9AGAM|nr:heme peroxidase [Sistotremastrum niveocremeum HHB9708]